MVINIIDGGVGGADGEVAEPVTIEVAGGQGVAELVVIGPAKSVSLQV